MSEVPMPEHVDEALRAVAKRETCWRERSRSMGPEPFAWFSSQKSRFLLVY